MIPAGIEPATFQFVEQHLNHCDRYSCTLSLTSALDGVGGQRHAPAVLPPEKTRYPLYRRLGGPQGRSGRVGKISPPTGIRCQNRPSRSESLHRLCVTSHGVYLAKFSIVSLSAALSFAQNYPRSTNSVIRSVINLVATFAQTTLLSCVHILNIS